MKVSKLLSVIMAFAFLLAACGPAATTAAPATAVPAKKTYADMVLCFPQLGAESDCFSRLEIHPADADVLGATLEGGAVFSVAGDDGF